MASTVWSAGCATFGLECESLALRTAPEALAGRLHELAAGGCTGCNLTHPLKEPALDHVARASDAAQRARSVNTIVFRPDGRWDHTDDANGHRITAGYDASGRISSLTDSRGDVTTYTYDGSGRISRVTDAVGRDTHYTYDAAGHVLSVTDARLADLEQRTLDVDADAAARSDVPDIGKQAVADVTHGVRTSSRGSRP